MSLCDKCYAEYNKNADGLARKLIISNYNAILDFLVFGENFQSNKDDDWPKFKA